MSKHKPRVRFAGLPLLGNLSWFDLRTVLRYAGTEDPDSWGVLIRHSKVFLFGDSVLAESVKLGVALSEILDLWNKKYDDWGSEELYVFFGLDYAGHFEWKLLTQVDFEAKGIVHKSAGSR